jgi:hypothetical protein
MIARTPRGPARVQKTRGLAPAVWRSLKNAGRSAVIPVRSEAHLPLMARYHALPRNVKGKINAMLDKLHEVIRAKLQDNECAPATMLWFEAWARICWVPEISVMTKFADAMLCDGIPPPPPPRLGLPEDHFAAKFLTLIGDTEPHDHVDASSAVDHPEADVDDPPRGESTAASPPASSASASSSTSPATGPADHETEGVERGAESDSSDGEYSGGSSDSSIERPTRARVTRARKRRRRQQKDTSSPRKRARRTSWHLPARKTPRSRAAARRRSSPPPESEPESSSEDEADEHDDQHLTLDQQLFGENVEEIIEAERQAQAACRQRDHFYTSTTSIHRANVVRSSFASLRSAASEEAAEPGPAASETAVMPKPSDSEMPPPFHTENAPAALGRAPSPARGGEATGRSAAATPSPAGGPRPTEGFASSSSSSASAPRTMAEQAAIQSAEEALRDFPNRESVRSMLIQAFIKLTISDYQDLVANIRHGVRFLSEATPGIGSAQ